MAEGQSTVERLLAQQGGDENSPIKELFNVDSTLKMKSEVPAGLIVKLAGAYTIAEITHSKVLRTFADNILMLQISKDRKGRIELMESLIARIRRDSDED